MDTPLAATNPSLDNLLAILGQPPPLPGPSPSAVRTPTATTMEININKRGLTEPLQVQAKSARGMTSDELASVLLRSAVQEKSPYVWSVEVMRYKFKEAKYTGDQTKLIATLHFFQDVLDICPTDRPAALLQWGQPLQAIISRVFDAYCTRYASEKAVNIHASGQTLGAVFRRFAQIIWPKSTAKKVAHKWRCFYGIRIKESATSMIPQPNPSDHTALTITNTTVQTPPNVTNLFYTPTGGSLSNHPYHSRQPHNQPGVFVPYYDILHNDDLYTVRVILPLMKENTAQNLDITVQPGRRKCIVKGSYIPSTLVGNESAKLLHLKQPLLPIIYSGPNTNGQFQLNIALPDDIRDDKQGIHVIHDCWGVLISLPRRKIVRDAQINLVSCFGSARVVAPRTPQTPQTSIQLHVSARSPSPPMSLTPDNKDAAADQHMDNPIDIQPELLIGRKIVISGERWGDQWKGKSYTGFIFKFDTTNGYVIFKAKFDDCEEDFDITDLLSHDLVSQDEFNLLKTTCLNEEQQSKWDANHPQVQSTRIHKPIIYIYICLYSGATTVTGPTTTGPSTIT